MCHHTPGQGHFPWPDGSDYRPNGYVYGHVGHHSRPAGFCAYTHLPISARRAKSALGSRPPVVHRGMNTTRPAAARPALSLAIDCSAALFLGIVPRAARVPSDLAALTSVAALSYCPVGSAERRDRSARIATMIASTLATAGR